VNTLYEEIKEEDKLRRWDYINFARRCRRMARAFLGTEKEYSGGFGLRVLIDQVAVREVSGCLK
jgi:hypothetical protein